MNRRLTALVLCCTALAAQSPSPADPEAVLARLRDAAQRLLTEERRKLQTADGKPWDVPLRAATLGDDPAAHLAFVREQIALEPYPGIQRGPSGTLVAKAGNPADRAFLLAELLRARGLRARVVRAELSEEAAAKVLEAALVSLRARQPETVTPFGRSRLDPAKVATRCEAVGLAPEQVQHLLAQRAAERDQRWTEVLDLTWREARFLAAQFGEPTVPARDLHADALQWLRTHYWVQVQGDDTEQWRDLDPSFPALTAGASATVATPEPIDPQVIADRLRFVVSMDRSVDGQAETVTLLDQEVAVHTTLLRPLRFMILPSKGYEQLVALVGSEDVEKVRTAVAACDRYQALLMAGQETLGSKVFDRQGGYFAVAPNGSLIGTHEKLQGVVDLFSGAAEEQAKTKLTGLRVRVSCEREGRELWGRVRDLSPPNERDSWFPTLHWQALAQTHAISRATVSALERRQLVDHASVLLAALDGRATVGARVRHYPSDLLQFARARGAQAAAAPVGLLFEHADLLIGSYRLAITESGRLAVERGIDLMENGALAVQAEGRLQIDRAATAELGVFDTVAEQVALRATQQAGATEGVLAPIERARLMSDKPMVLRADDLAALRAAKFAAPDAEWIVQHATPSERVLCFATAPGAWWSRQEATGRTVGRIHGGRGGCVVRSESAEATIVTKFSLEVSVCLGLTILRVALNRYEMAQLLETALCFMGAAAGIADMPRMEIALLLLAFALDAGEELADAYGSGGDGR